MSGMSRAGVQAAQMLQEPRGMLRERQGTIVTSGLTAEGRAEVLVAGVVLLLPVVGDWTPEAGREAMIVSSRSGNMRVVGMVASGPGTRTLVRGVRTATPDASGYSTWNHDLGVVPTGVFVQGRSPIGGGTLADRPIVDSLTSTQARVRWIGYGSGAITWAWMAVR
jgi:hypothetical protein